MRIRRFNVLLALYLVLSFLCACERFGVTEKPCLMVHDTVYYLSPWEVTDVIPSGYEPAGVIEKVDGFPRSELTGNCPSGSVVYTNPSMTDAVYLSMPGNETYTCFTVERLQYTWLVIGGDLYLLGDDYAKLNPNSDGHYPEVANGNLPENSVWIGKIDAAVRDMMPENDFQTNSRLIVGYSVFKDTLNEDVVYVTPDKTRAEALAFVKTTGGY